MALLHCKAQPGLSFESLHWAVTPRFFLNLETQGTMWANLCQIYDISRRHAQFQKTVNKQTLANIMLSCPLTFGNKLLYGFMHAHVSFWYVSSSNTQPSLALNTF